jgi:hypothetical protein
LHTALHERVFDTGEFGKPRLDHDGPLHISPARHEAH